jgi:peptidoglycan/LPS O-acetylase OafA/YrhL
MPTISTLNSSSTRSNKDRQARRFYPQLDGLRAVAILLVLMFHMSDLRLPGPLAYLASPGWAGVDAFFVISGFLITSILLNNVPGPRAFGLFVLRRTLRTWPLYFLILFIASLNLQHSMSGTSWLQHLFFLQNYSPSFVTYSLG